MCHAYFTRYFLPFRGNIYTLKMCIAKMWKLNPLNKFSRPYCSAACTEHTLNSSSSAVFRLAERTFLVSTQTVSLDFNRLCLNSFQWNKNIRATRVLHLPRTFRWIHFLPLHRFALALLIFIWIFFLCVCKRVKLINRWWVVRRRCALQNNLKLELCEINNKRNEFFPFIDQY